MSAICVASIFQRIGDELAEAVDVIYRTRSPMTRLTASRRRQRPQHVADACGWALNLFLATKQHKQHKESKTRYMELVILCTTNTRILVVPRRYSNDKTLKPRMDANERE